jgi:vacuolar-type H+-ATPase subunit H
MSQTQPPVGMTSSDEQQKEPAEKEPPQIAKIEADLDQTRNAISGDLRTLGERLSPEHLKEEAKEVMTEAKNVAVGTLHEAKDVATSAFRQAKDDAMESVSEKYREIRDDVRAVEREAVGFVRQNAVPLALMGLGVAWFVSNQRNRDRDWDGDYAPRDYGRWRYPERGGSHAVDEARDGVSRAAETTRQYGARAKQRARGWLEGAEREAGDVAGRVRDFAEREVEQARGLAHEAAERSTRTAYQVRHGATRNARRAWDWSRQSADSHPLAVAAAAMAVGVVAGLVIPETRRESEWLGPERDRLFGEAKEVVSDAKDAARDLTHAAKDTAREVRNSLKSSTSGATG